MKKVKLSSYSLGLGLFALMSMTAVSCDKDDENDAPVESNTVLDVAADAGLSTLVSAVGTAGLTTTLNGAGPFTVFAPTNAAFSAINVPTDPAVLGDVLRYHVIGAEVTASALPTSYASGVVTANGDSVYPKRFPSGNAYVNGVKVDIADADASNGVAHVIGTVLMPPSESIVAIAQSSNDFSLLVQAVLKCNLAGALTGPGPFTVFAPTNAAFTAAGFDSTAIADADAATVTALTNVLLYHVVPARAFSADIIEGLTSAPTLLTGETLSFSTTGGAKVTGSGNGGNASNITAVNLVAQNGVVHVIDRVLLP